MVLYRYVKEKPKKKRAKSFISLALSLSGLFLIAYVVYPILAFELFEAPRFAQLVSPIAEKSEFTYKTDQSSDDNVLGESDSANLNENIDYINVSNWFPKKPQIDTETSGRIYFLSIPKLRIENAIVEIAGKSLDNTLIHYGGTGLPGEYGNAVIFGHSILPQFYNPKNYKSIFSLLPKLNLRDEIFIKFDGVIYKYLVSDMRITSAEDISVLEQRYDDSYISLITCVPPGTYWKRLVVTARLVKY